MVRPTVSSATLLAAIALSVIAAKPAEAQYGKRTVEAGLTVGGILDPKHTNKTSSGVLLRSLAYSVTDVVQIGARFGEAIDGKGRFLSLVSAEANVLLPRTGMLIPYVGMHGRGMFRYDDGVVATGSYGVQGGSKFLVTERFAISLEVGSSLPMTGTQTPSVSILAGVTWLFPSTPPSSGDGASSP